LIGHRKFFDRKPEMAAVLAKFAKTTPPVICDNDVQAFYEIARSRWSTGGEIVL
jgi:hypothetical protein